MIVSFITATIYTKVEPYRNKEDNRLQMLCQIGIFFALISKVMLEFGTDTQANTVGILLVLMACLPVASVFAEEFLAMPLCKDADDAPAQQSRSAPIQHIVSVTSPAGTSSEVKTSEAGVSSSTTRV